MELTTSKWERYKIYIDLKNKCSIPHKGKYLRQRVARSMTLQHTNSNGRIWKSLLQIMYSYPEQIPHEETIVLQPRAFVGQ